MSRVRPRPTSGAPLHAPTTMARTSPKRDRLNNEPIPRGLEPSTRSAPVASATPMIIVHCIPRPLHHLISVAASTARRTLLQACFTTRQSCDGMCKRRSQRSDGTSSPLMDCALEVLLLFRGVSCVHRPTVTLSHRNTIKPSHCYAGVLNASSDTPRSLRLSPTHHQSLEGLGHLGVRPQPRPRRHLQIRSRVAQGDNHIRTTVP